MLLMAGSAGALAGVFGMGLQGTGGDHLQGCPCILSPAALLNKETFSLLFLLHPDTFLLMLFLLLTCFNRSWGSSIEFWDKLGSLYHQKKKTQKTPSRKNIVDWESS